jgi:hypothetical protein
MKNFSYYNVSQHQNPKNGFYIAIRYQIISFNEGIDHMGLFGFNANRQPAIDTGFQIAVKDLNHPDLKDASGKPIEAIDPQAFLNYCQADSARHPRRKNRIARNTNLAKLVQAEQCALVCGETPVLLNAQGNLELSRLKALAQANNPHILEGKDYAMVMGARATAQASTLAQKTLKEVGIDPTIVLGGMPSTAPTATAPTPVVNGMTLPGLLPGVPLTGTATSGQPPSSPTMTGLNGLDIPITG